MTWEKQNGVFSLWTTGMYVLTPISFLCTPVPKFYLVYWLCIIERYIPHHSKIYHSCSKNGKDIRWADAAGNYSLGIQLYKTLLPNDVGNINRKCWFSSYSIQITSQCCRVQYENHTGMGPILVHKYLSSGVWSSMSKIFCILKL